MGVAFGTRTAWVADVTSDICKLLVKTGLFAQDGVYECMNPVDLLAEEPTNDRACAIFPGRFPTNAGGINDGSPSNWDVVDGVFSIDVVARISSGKPRRNAEEFKKQSRGFSDMTLKVAKALHRKTFADGSGNTYLEEPTRVLDVVFNSSNGLGAWNKATVIISAQFRADFS